MEEKHLRALAPAVAAYLDFALAGKGIARHHFIRQLLALSRRMSVELLSRSLERARKYRISNLETEEDSVSATREGQPCRNTFLLCHSSKSASGRNRSGSRMAVSS